MDIPRTSTPRTFASQQGRNHVFKVGGPVPWSRVLLPFYRKKLDRSTQFGAIGYIPVVTLFIKKLRENLGVRLNFWGSGPPSDCALISILQPAESRLTAISCHFDHDKSTVSMSMSKYTVSGKKEATLFSTTTLAFLGRFL